MLNFSSPVYQKVDIDLTATGTYTNPFKETEVYAVFTHGDGTSIKQYGFFKGGDSWCIRFAPIKEGAWSFTTCSEDAGLNGISGTLTATANEMRHDLDKHGWVKLEKGTRYFLYEDGTPFFWLGDTHWQGLDFERIHSCNYPGCTCGNQFKHVVDDRVKKGFSVYQTYFSSGRNSSDPEKEVLPWWKDDYETINVDAFEKADYMFEYLASQGFTIALGMGLHTQTYTQMKKRVEPLLLFTKYVVARYSAYPIIWLTGQEITQFNHDALLNWFKVGAYIEELDGYNHPRGAHMYPLDLYSPEVKETDAQPWHQYFMLQAGHGAAARFKDRFFYKSYYDNSDKIYIEGECQYEDIYYQLQNDSDHNRKGAWLAMLSGASGFTYGVTGVWALSWGSGEKSPFDSYNPEPWYIGMDKHGSFELGYMKEFLTRFPFWKLTPVFGDIGAFEQRKFACGAKCGDDAFIWYFYDTTIEEGVLHQLQPDTEYYGYWFDVCTGKYIPTGKFTTDELGYAELGKRPCPRDWVFVATKTELTDIVTENAPLFFKSPIEPITNMGKQSLIKRIKASSFNKEHPIGNVLDGQEDTYWEPYSNVTCQTIDIELDEEQDGGYLFMKVLNPEYRWYNYRIWGSNDGVNYDLVQDISSGWNHDIATYGKEGRCVHTRELVGSYKYIRFFINSNMYKTPLQISRLEIYKK